MRSESGGYHCGSCGVKSLVQILEIATSTDRVFLLLVMIRFEFEHSCWDPKDGDLCLSRVKPGETLVEARSDTDVQIVRQIWV